MFYETQCRDAIIVQINPIERHETPRQPAEIRNRIDEVTFNASLLAELRAADFVARLIRRGLSKATNIARSGCIASAARAGSNPSARRPRATSPGLSSTNCATSARAEAKEWLEANFDKIGVEGTLDIDQTLKRDPAKAPTTGAPATTR